MIDDGVKGLGKGDDVQVADISMHILEAIEAGEAGRTESLHGTAPSGSTLFETVED
jgi:hypothetical protein